MTLAKRMFHSFLRWPSPLEQRTRVRYEHKVSSYELRFYYKLTKSERTKHAHKDELIGWDNLYNERPHVHYDEDERREYREEKISWEEIRATIERLERRDDN